MRNRKPFSIGGFITLFIIFEVLFGSVGSILPLLITAGVVGWLAWKSVQASRKLDDAPAGRATRTSGNTTRSYGMNDSNHSAAEKARVNTYLMKRFAEQDSIRIQAGGHGYVLTNNATRFRTIDLVKLTVDGRNYQSAGDFRRSNPSDYDQLFNTLLNLAMAETATKQANVVDADFVPSGQKFEEEKKEEPKQTFAKPVSDALRFRDEINELNDDIPDEEISNMLYETTALLKQLSDLEESFPASKPKLKKLYNQYLPYMTNILKQYTKMQNVQTDPNYKANENALKETIGHINAAMKDRLIPSMSENDSINLSADMNTLEAMLRKDGMSDENDISLVLKKQKEEEAEKQGS